MLYDALIELFVLFKRKLGVDTTKQTQFETCAKIISNLIVIYGKKKDFFFKLLVVVELMFKWEVISK